MCDGAVQRIFSSISLSLSFASGDLWFCQCKSFWPSLRPLRIVAACMISFSRVSLWQFIPQWSGAARDHDVVIAWQIVATSFISRNIFFFQFLQVASCSLMSLSWASDSLMRNPSFSPSVWEKAKTAGGNRFLSSSRRSPQLYDLEIVCSKSTRMLEERKKRTKGRGRLKKNREIPVFFFLSLVLTPNISNKKGRVFSSFPFLTSRCSGQHPMAHWYRVQGHLVYDDDDQKDIHTEK